MVSVGQEARASSMFCVCLKGKRQQSAVRAVYGWRGKCEKCG